MAKHRRRAHPALRHPLLWVGGVAAIAAGVGLALAYSNRAAAMPAAPPVPSPAPQAPSGATGDQVVTTSDNVDTGGGGAAGDGGDATG